MEEIVYNKLIRDNLLDVIKEKTGEPIYRVATEWEFEKHLNFKLKEEVEEFLLSPNTEELADILEVIDALTEFYGFTMDEILQVKQKKSQEKGAFKNRIILEKIVKSIK